MLKTKSSGYIEKKYFDAASTEKVKNGELFTFEVRVIKRNGKLFTVIKYDKNTAVEHYEKHISNDSNSDFNELQETIKEVFDGCYRSFSSNTIAGRSWEKLYFSVVEFTKKVNKIANTRALDVNKFMTFEEYLDEFHSYKED